MRILYFTQSQTPHDLRFLNALAQTDHQVAVLCLEEAEGRLWPTGIEELKWPQIVAESSRKTPALLVRGFREVVRQFSPDVVHAGPIQKVAAIAARAGVHPLLSMSWGSDLLMEAERSWRSAWLAHYTLRRTDLLAVDCNTVVKKALDLGYHGPLAVFPWGVDLQHFSPDGKSELRAQLGWQNEFVLLSNRSLEPLYSVETIAWAFILASQQNDRLRLMIFGSGSQEAKIRALLEKAGLLDRVYFGGFAALDRLLDVYRSADVYLSASHSDGSSVSLMEALACARPVIVSDIPSNQEWVKPAQQGWLFKDGDAQDLSVKMLEAAASPHLAEMAANNRHLAEERADWTKNFQKLLDAYALVSQLVK